MADMIFGVGRRVASLEGTGSMLGNGGTEAAGGTTFADTLKQALEGVSAVQDNASSVAQAYLRGEPVELHQVMAAGEEAGIALQMLVELRNKLTEAYRTVVNMQS